MGVLLIGDYVASGLAQCLAANQYSQGKNLFLAQFGAQPIGTTFKGPAARSVPKGARFYDESDIVTAYSLLYGRNRNYYERTLTVGEKESRIDSNNGSFTRGPIYEWYKSATNREVKTHTSIRPTDINFVFVSVGNQEEYAINSCGYSPTKYLPDDYDYLGRNLNDVFGKGSWTSGSRIKGFGATIIWLLPMQSGVRGRLDGITPQILSRGKNEAWPLYTSDTIQYADPNRKYYNDPAYPEGRSYQVGDPVQDLRQTRGGGIPDPRTETLTSVTDYVKILYNVILGREPETEGWDYWKSQMLATKTGTWTGDVFQNRLGRTDIIKQFYGSFEARANSTYPNMTYYQIVSTARKYGHFVWDMNLMGLPIPSSNYKNYGDAVAPSGPTYYYNKYQRQQINKISDPILTADGYNNMWRIMSSRTMNFTGFSTMLKTISNVYLPVDSVSRDAAYEQAVKDANNAGVAPPSAS